MGHDVQMEAGELFGQVQGGIHSLGRGGCHRDRCAPWKVSCLLQNVAHRDELELGVLQQSRQGHGRITPRRPSVSQWSHMLESGTADFFLAIHSVSSSSLASSKVGGSKPANICSQILLAPCTASSSPSSRHCSKLELSATDDR